MHKAIVEFLCSFLCLVFVFCRAEVEVDDCLRPPKVRNARVIQGCGMKDVECDYYSVSVLKCDHSGNVYGFACDGGKWTPAENTIKCAESCLTAPKPPGGSITHHVRGNCDLNNAPCDHGSILEFECTEDRNRRAIYTCQLGMWHSSIEDFHCRVDETKSRKASKDLAKRLIKEMESNNELKIAKSPDEDDRRDSVVSNKNLLPNPANDVKSIDDEASLPDVKDKLISKGNDNLAPSVADEGDKALPESSRDDIDKDESKESVSGPVELDKSKPEPKSKNKIQPDDKETENIFVKIETNPEVAECCRIKIEITERDESGTRYCPCNDDCTVFFACYKSETNTISYEKEHCPEGMKYNDEKRQCVPMFGDKCGDDPCSKEAEAGSKPISVWSTGKADECATYYKCKNSESVKTCCEPSTSWNSQIKMCLFDTTCKDPGCAPKITTKSLATRTQKDTLEIDLMTCMDTRYKVMRRKIRGDPKSYVIIMKDGSKHRMPCPPATSFSVKKCKCSGAIKKSLKLKKNEIMLNLPLTDDDRDHSPNKFTVLPIGKKPVDIKNEAACFSEMSSALEVVGVNDLEVDKQLSLSFWINIHCSRQTDLGMGILGNRKADFMATDSYSIIAHYDKESFGQYVDEKVYVSFQTQKKVYYNQLFADVTCGKWQHIVFTYDGTWLLLYLDGSTQSIEAGDGSPVLWQIESLMKVGKDELYGSFKGCLKKVVIFKKVLGKKAIRAIGRTVRPKLLPCDC